nr:hypothetical protein BDOA9_0154070 [Bradyrhizobium sp. DOA9]
MGRALAKPIMLQHGESVDGFRFALPILRIKGATVTTHPVIASAAKQSRLPLRKDSGLFRCARNDGWRQVCAKTPAVCPGHSAAFSSALRRLTRCVASGTREHLRETVTVSNTH